MIIISPLNYHLLLSNSHSSYFTIFIQIIIFFFFDYIYVNLFYIYYLFISICKFILNINLYIYHFYHAIPILLYSNPHPLKFDPFLLDPIFFFFFGEFYV